MKRSVSLIRSIAQVGLLLLWFLVFLLPLTTITLLPVGSAQAAPRPTPLAGQTQPWRLSWSPVTTIYLPLVFAPGNGPVGPQPINGLSASNDGPVSLGQPVTLAATVIQGSGVQYVWDFGDGQALGYGPVVSHAYTTVGQFNATVHALNGVSAKSATTLVIIEDTAPVAAFTSSSPDLLGEATHFVNTSTGTNLSFVWDFGDSSALSNQPNPSHTYLSSGRFTVTLTASNSRGSHSRTGQVIIEEPSGPPPPPPAPAALLRGYWPLDESSGQRQDLSGYNNHLGDNNGAAAMPSLIGQAADLEANFKQALSLDHALQQGLAVTGSLTLAGWFNVEDFSQPVQVLLGKYEATGDKRAYRLELRANDRLGFEVSPDGAFSSDNLLEATLTYPLEVDTWYHLAAVFDAAGQTLAIYLNGRPVASRSVTFNRIHPAPAPFVLGGNLSNGLLSETFDGKLDEWRLYGQALTPGEVTTLIPASFLPPAPAGFDFIMKHPSADTQPTALGKTLHGAILHQDKIYWGFGDKRDNTGPIDIAPFDPATLTFAPVEHVAGSEVIYHFRVLSNGKLYIPHIDPNGDLTGFDYSRKDASGWVQLVAASMYHLYDIVERNDNIYLVGSKGTSAVVFEADMASESSFKRILEQPNSVIVGADHARYHFGFVFNGKLYVQAGTGDGKKRAPTSMVYDGQSWQAGPDLLPLKGHGSYASNFAGRVIYKAMGESNNSRLYSFAGQSVTTARLDIMNYVIYGDEVFVLQPNGLVVKSKDLLNWLEVGRVVADSPVSIAIAADRIFVGAKGARLYRSSFALTPAN
jgi:PKD repeat protein